MNLIRKNHYDEGLRAMLRVSESRSAGTRVGALTTNTRGEKIVSFPAWIFGGIVGFGLLGGAAAAYFEHKSKVGWDNE